MEASNNSIFCKKIENFLLDLKKYQQSGHQIDSNIRKMLNETIENVTSLLVESIHIKNEIDSNPNELGLGMVSFLSQYRSAQKKPIDESTKSNSFGAFAKQCNKTNEPKEIIMCDVINKGIKGDAALFRPMTAMAFNALFKNYPHLKPCDDILGPLKKK